MRYPCLRRGSLELLPSHRRYRRLPPNTAATRTTTTTGPRHYRLLSHSRVDLRSDTVTAPCPALLDAARTAVTGDDVYQEDPTVQRLEQEVAERCGFEPHGLFLPTATMANLVAVLAHADRRGTELITGAHAHISLWEAGHMALTGVYARSWPEDVHTAQLDPQQIRRLVNADDDDDDVQQCPTALLCLENTHNLLGGVALPPAYLPTLAAALKPDFPQLRLHLDGARLGNAAVAQQCSLADLTAGADSVTFCLSKGLGAPLGSVLVGHDAEFRRRARRARQRVGGGMRQAGVVAAMGLAALQQNYDRLADDHARARYLAQILQAQGFSLLRGGKVDTNMVYFQLPDASAVAPEQFVQRLYETFGVKVTGGYNNCSDSGNFFRAVTHLDVNDEDIQYAARAMVQLCEGG
jgi:threonine aldolase